MEIISKNLLTKINNIIINNNNNIIKRKFSQRSWNIVRFDQDLKRAIEFNSSSQLPILNRPNEIMIKVLASSVNPLDIEMSRGYGNVLLSLGNTVMSCGIDKLSYGRLPVTPGRDFVGEIISKGQNVWNYKPGDVVWGTVPPYENGSHADYVITTDNCISYKPKNLSNVEAAAIPYIGLTAWSALSTFGELNAHNSYKKNVLVLGGNGGVGCFAIQLLKFWGANVTTTCSEKTMKSLKELTSVDECIDYTKMDEYLRQYKGTFDLILDASSTSASKKNYNIIKTIINENQQNNNNNNNKQQHIYDRKRTIYVTLSSPLLNNYDNYGLISGTINTISDILIDTLNGIQHGINFRWAYYLPNPKALSYITQLVEQNKIKTSKMNVYDFDKAIDAYEAFDHSIGKIVINNDK